MYPMVFEALLRRKPVERAHARAADAPIGVGKRGAPFGKPRYGKHVTGEGERGRGRGRGRQTVGLSKNAAAEGGTEGGREDGVTWC